MRRTSCLLFVAVVLFSCKARQGVQSGLYSATDGTPPTAAGSRLDVDEVVKAMNDIKKHDGAVATQSVVEACTANDTPHWSPIVSHFYCQIGAGRACFTSYVRNSSNPGYQTTRIYMDGFEACKNDANFSWVYNHPTVSQVFKYVMFTVYSPTGLNSFSIESQDEAINKFYGVTDVGNCNKRYKSSTDNRRPTSERCGTFTSVTPVPPPVTPQPVTPQPINPQPVTPTPPSGANCSMQTSAGTCGQQANCFWAYNKRSKKIGCFVKKGQSCDYYSDFDAGSCSAQGSCFWAYNKKTKEIGCFAKTGQSCGYYSDFDAGSCAAQSNCFWAYNKRTKAIGCFIQKGQSCSYYSDFDAGTCGAQANCKWWYNPGAKVIECANK